MRGLEGRRAGRRGIERGKRFALALDRLGEEDVATVFAADAFFAVGATAGGFAAARDETATTAAGSWFTDRVANRTAAASTTATGGDAAAAAGSALGAAARAA